jgi:hypothetical protein
MAKQSDDEMSGVIAGAFGSTSSLLNEMDKPQPNQA